MDKALSGHSVSFYNNGMANLVETETDLSVYQIGKRLN